VALRWRQWGNRCVVGGTDVRGWVYVILATLASGMKGIMYVLSVSCSYVNASTCILTFNVYPSHQYSTHRDTVRLVCLYPASTSVLSLKWLQR